MILMVAETLLPSWVFMVTNMLAQFCASSVTVPHLSKATELATGHGQGKKIPRDRGILEARVGIEPA